MNILRVVYWIVFSLGLLAAVLIYFVFFDSFSETELVYLSFAWIAALLFGGSGLLFHIPQERRKREALDDFIEDEKVNSPLPGWAIPIIVVGGLLLLAVFFSVFWSSL